MTTAFLGGIGDRSPSTDCVLHRTSRLGACLLAVGLLLTAALVPASQAQHPTAVTSIVNSSADTTLEGCVPKPKQKRGGYLSND